MEQDPHMDHDQTNEPSGPHETHDEDETGQINDEEQPNNDEFETNESNEGAEAQGETRPTRTRTQPSRFQDYVVQVPPSVKHPTSTSNQVTSTEVKALEKNGTWTLEYLLEGKRAIDSKWVYKIKFKPNGEVERYKARLVAKGFTQMEGMDYHDTFAPVAKLVTVRTLLTIAVKTDWIIHQLDVNNAFLHGDLDEEVYMKIPQGFSNDNETRVCRLRKSLYGSIMVVVLIYVDDVIITGNNLTKIQETKKQLDDEFSIKDLGLLKGCKPSAFPIEQGLKLDKGESESRVNASQYRRLIGRLLYLQATRPDITYSVNILSQFVADPRNNHLEVVNRVLGYLKATPGQGILISQAGDPVLTAYCDSDWLGCPYTRRSRTGYMLLLGQWPSPLVKSFGFDGCSVADPISLGDFRPISLIGCYYKILAKILAERVKKVIGEVVGDVQNAFIKGRSIVDGVLIANETVEYLMKSKGKCLVFKEDP
ncbi:putative RNA-directed DNA polymerase [Tanacetum coccineum]